MYPPVNPTLPVIATHLLALHLIVVGPILDYFETGPLRTRRVACAIIGSGSFGFGWQPLWRVGRKASEISRPWVV